MKLLVIKHPLPNEEHQLLEQLLARLASMNIEIIVPSYEDIKQPQFWLQITPDTTFITMGELGEKAAQALQSYFNLQPVIWVGTRLPPSFLTLACIPRLIGLYHTAEKKNIRALESRSISIMDMTSIESFAAKIQFDMARNAFYAEKNSLQNNAAALENPTQRALLQRACITGHFDFDREVWDIFYRTRVATAFNGNPANLLSQTHEAFAFLSPEQHVAFRRSTRPVVQFGGGTCTLMQYYPRKKIFNYDYTQTASDIAVNTFGDRVTVRPYDLNHPSIYEAILTEDLTEPVDILLVDILQYLEPSALVMLMIMLLNHLKPGSSLFLKHSISNNSEEGLAYLEPCESINFNYPLSFFAPRVDIDIQSNIVVKTHDSAAQIMMLGKTSR